jgi:hypothetical protein
VRRVIQGFVSRGGGAFTFAVGALILTLNAGGAMADWLLKQNHECRTDGQACYRSGNSCTALVTGIINNCIQCPSTIQKSCYPETDFSCYEPTHWGPFFICPEGERGVCVLQTPPNTYVCAEWEADDCDVYQSCLAGP